MIGETLLNSTSLDVRTSLDDGHGSAGRLAQSVGVVLVRVQPLAPMRYASSGVVSE